MKRGYYRERIINESLDKLKQILKDEIDDLENSIEKVLWILKDESIINNEKVKEAFYALEDIHDGLY